MKLTLGEIRLMKDPMISLLDKDVPIKAAWKINKLAQTFNKELNEIEEFRIKLVRKLGVTDEGNEESITVPDEKMEEFVDSFNELLNQETEFDFEPMDIEALGDIEMTAKDMVALEKLFY